MNNIDSAFTVLHSWAIRRARGCICIPSLWKEMTWRVACIRFQFCQECHGFLVTWDHHILLGTLMLSSWGRVNNLSHSLCAQCSPRYGPMRNCTYSYLRSSRILNLGNMKPPCGNFAKIRILERLCTNLAFFSPQVFQESSHRFR